LSRTPVIRAARVEEAIRLSDLAFRSKAHWGYDDVFMAACRAELEVDLRHIDDPACLCYVAETGDGVSGYYTAIPIAEDACELEALFVEPSCIGAGIGRALLMHAVQTLRDRGVRRLVIQGDPHATPFYLACSAKPVGERESTSIPGRMLPLFEIDLT